jgi:cytochrome b6-f complex iron-sulfur subunit
MAKRPSVKEILEAARRGGPAKPADAEGAAPASEPEPAPAPEETAAAAEAAPAAEAVAPPPTPASLGRPLTLKEKLAAARAGGAAVPGAAPAKAAPAPAEAAAEAPAAAEGPKTVPAPPPSIGRPLTLKEKLAAARSGGASAPATGGGGAAAKPAAAKPAAGAAAAAKPAAARVLPPLDKITDPKDLAEALRQAGEKKAKEAAAAAAPAKPAPAKGGHAKETKPQSVLPKPSKGATAGAAVEAATRRGFLFGAMFVSWVAVGWASFTAGCVAFTAMMGRFMFPNVLAEPPSTIKIGLPTNFEPEEVNERFKAEWGFWVVRSTRYNGTDIVYALQSVCTHLGCPPNWLAGEQKFKCPCHGSGFYISGINFEGPAPRPLERFKVTVADDGQIIVDKSQKFQQELGQWSDPDSFIVA